MNFFFPVACSRFNGASLRQGRVLIAFAAHDRQISANMVLAAVIAPSADPYAAFRLCELEVLTRPAGGASSSYVANAAAVGRDSKWTASCGDGER